MVSVTCGAGGPCSSPLALAVSRGFNQSIRPCPISSPGHPDREAAQRNGSFVLPTVERVAVNRLRLYAGTLTWFNVLPANRYIIREPTSGLEPLTSSHYEWSLRRCRGVQRIANPAYSEGFLCSALHRIALPVASEWCQFQVRIRLRHSVNRPAFEGSPHKKEQDFEVSLILPRLRSRRCGHLCLKYTKQRRR